VSPDTRRDFGFVAMLALLVGAISIGDALGAEPVANVSSPRLSSDMVSSLARAEVVRNGVRVERYKSNPPTYNSDERNWFVFFIQKEPPFDIDGDILVVIDDTTGKPCVENGTAVGPCKSGK
jgi:hypothetical protein